MHRKSVIFANIVLSGMALIFMLATVYLLYKSKSPQTSLNFKLIIPSATAFLFFFLALFIRNNWKINVAVFVFSGLMAVYGVELVLFVKSNTRFPQEGIDTRNKLEVLEDLRAEGVDAWPQVLSWLFVKSNGLASENDRIFPLGGISRKAIVYCNESGQWKIFKSDEHGFNNREDQYRKDNIKIALMGDSFTIGSCVKSGEDIAGRLQNMGINSLNLGNGGNGPLIELALLEEYVKPISPEIVLWIYFEGNDLSDLEKERTSSMLMRYLEDGYSQNLINRQVEIDSALMKYVDAQWVKEVKLPQMRNVINNMVFAEQEEKKRGNKLKPLKLWYLRDRVGLINKPEKPKREVTFNSQLQLFSQIIAKAQNRTARWGAKFFFVYLPEMERYVGNNDNGAFFDRDDVLAIVHKLGIPVIDFHEVLGRHPNPLSLTPFLGAHYNAEGYKLLTDLVVSRLRKDGVLSSTDR